MKLHPPRFASLREFQRRLERIHCAFQVAGGALDPADNDVRKSKTVRKSACGNVRAGGYRIHQRSSVSMITAEQSSLQFRDGRGNLVPFGCKTARCFLEKSRRLFIV